MIKEFHATGHFLHGEILRRPKISELYMSMIFWTLLPYVILYFLYTHFWFKCIVIGHTVFLLFINYVMDGFPEFEIGMYNFKKKLFSNPW